MDEIRYTMVANGSSDRALLPMTSGTFLNSLNNLHVKAIQV
jgi:hypothetical protein